MCSPEGTIFDITNILPWLRKHGTNPVNGAPLKQGDLIKLTFAKNEDGEMVDPVTFKMFTDNTHIVALKNTGNVFAYDTVERLNIKAKNWTDLVSEEEFGRKDIVTLQDPQNVESRNLSCFKYLKEGTDTATPEQQRERNDPSNNVNTAALGNGAAILKARSKKEQRPDINPDALASNRESISRINSSLSKSSTAAATTTITPTPAPATKSALPPPASSKNAHARHTTGLAAASLTSTGLTPHTTADLATLSQETYLLQPRRVKTKGYLSLALSPASLGALTLELAPEFAPKACYNFLALVKAGYYDNVPFHRNLRNFMIQGGDPTGTGKGGQSIWAPKNFEDEVDGPLKFDRRGVLAMANKGKDTNGSQFFITYRPCPHLQRKHTIFGNVIVDDDASSETMKNLENIPADEKGRPESEILINRISILVDPFEAYLKDEEEQEGVEEAKRRRGGSEDERVTWTGRRVGPGWEESRMDGGGGGVGRYLKVHGGGGRDGEGGGGGGGVGGGRGLEEWEGGMEEEPARKKMKMKVQGGGGGFGNFDGW